MSADPRASDALCATVQYIPFDVSYLSARAEPAVCISHRTVTLTTCAPNYGAFDLLEREASRQGALV